MVRKFGTVIHNLEDKENHQGLHENLAYETKYEHPPILRLCQDIPDLGCAQVEKPGVAPKGESFASAAFDWNLRGDHVAPSE